VVRREEEIGYRTPFQQLPSMANELGYMRALHKNKENCRTAGISGAKKRKVSTIARNIQGEFEIISHKPSEWEWLIRPAETATRASS